MYDKKSIKVDAYDFFGYMIPGFVLLFSIFLAHVGATKKLSYMRYFESFNFLSTKIETAQYVTVVAFVVLTSYILGHVVGSIAAFFYEKLVVKKIFGYPYKILFSNPTSNNLHSADHYRAFFVTTYATIFSFIFFPKEFLIFIKIHYWALIIAIAICACTHKLLPFISDAVAWTLSKPFLLLEFIGGHFVNKHAPFPNTFQMLLRTKFEDEFGIKMDSDISPETFWAIYWSTTSRDEYIRAKIEKWMILYSFMRNMGCAFLISAVIISIPQIFLPETDKFIKSHSIALVVLSSIFILRYYYLYYSYYSKNTFRAFVYVSKKDSPKPAIEESE